MFPFATLAFLRFHVDINWGCILLMALGSQWYILFNVIGGAQAVPNDMREMAQNVGLKGVKQWRYVIAPAIFGSWVTGAITASGGACERQYRQRTRLVGRHHVARKRAGRLHC